MGMHGPLTAQALGRSPYDDVVEREEEQHNDASGTTQQYDSRGRPVNPETRRINRDIIRSHNEVMLVIGVAEPENPAPAPEAESEMRHDEYEDNVGLAIAGVASRCVENVAVFGLNGLRERVLIYKRYSNIPFWDLYQQAKRDFSIPRDVLPGALTSLLSNHLERQIATLWQDRTDRIFPRLFVHEVWSYIKAHVELFVATQRLGLIENTLWFPPLTYFIPFTQASPIPAPPPLKDFSLDSIVECVGTFCIRATPFLFWVLAQRLKRDWRTKVWKQILPRLPSTRNPVRLQPSPSASNTARWQQPFEAASIDPEIDHSQELSNDMLTSNAESSLETDAGAARRASTYSARGDEYLSDDEHEGLTATLISFDVEATETTEAPAGLWSAELRPSQEVRVSSSQPLFRDTILTQLPALVASHVFTDAVLRIIMVPYEATALRLVAQMIRERRGLSCLDLCHANLLNGLTWTSVVNLLGVDLLILALAGEVWASVTCVAQWFHMSEEEWKEYENKERQGEGSSWRGF